MARDEGQEGPIGEKCYCCAFGPGWAPRALGERPLVSWNTIAWFWALYAKPRGSGRTLALLVQEKREAGGLLYLLACLGGPHPPPGLLQGTRVWCEHSLPSWHHGHPRLLKGRNEAGAGQHSLKGVTMHKGIYFCFCPGLFLMLQTRDGQTIGQGCFAPAE